MPSYRDFYLRTLRASYDKLMRRGRAYISFRALSRAYGLPLNRDWIVWFASEAERTGHAKVDRFPSDLRDRKLSIEGPGLQLVQENLKLDPNWGLFKISSEAAAYDAKRVGEVTIPAENIEPLVAGLKQAEQRLDRLSIGNVEKAQARAYIIATLALAEAPEPPADLMWELLQRANNIAGIASLLVAVIALFVAVG